MSRHHQPSIIERLAEGMGLIPNLHKELPSIPSLTEPGSLTQYPPPDRWDDWEEYEATGWARKEKKKYTIVPTTCFNCESVCGLLAYIDKDKNAVRKFEGNPYHPASRGRNCAKGPATINQINDPERILFPLKREGKRGDGKWKQVTWDEVLDDIAGRIRKALQQNF